MPHETFTRMFAAGGRVLVLLGFLALMSAWITELTDRPLWGMSQQHLLFDAVAMTVLGIAFMAGSVQHARRL